MGSIYFRRYVYYSVSLSGGRAAVGAQGDDSTGDGSGRAYLYYYGFSAEIDADISQNPNVVHPHHVGGSGVSAIPKDVMPLVVFGSSKAAGDPVDFDTTLIDPASLRFGPNRRVISPNTTPIFSVDYNDDGVLDAQFDFPVKNAGIGCNFEEVTLTGSTLEGDRFAASDSISADCEASCH